MNWQPVNTEEVRRHIPRRMGRPVRHGDDEPPGSAAILIKSIRGREIRSSRPRLFSDPRSLLAAHHRNRFAVAVGVLLGGVSCSSLTAHQRPDIHTAAGIVNTAIFMFGAVGFAYALLRPFRSFLDADSSIASRYPWWVPLALGTAVGISGRYLTIRLAAGDIPETLMDLLQICLP